MLFNWNILNVRNEWCIILNACRNVNSLCTGGASPYADLGSVPTTPKVAASFLGILILPQVTIPVNSINEKILIVLFLSVFFRFL